jgi:hypothetical protein
LFLVEFCSLPLYRSSSYPPFSFFFLSDHSFAIFFSHVNQHSSQEYQCNII